MHAILINPDTNQIKSVKVGFSWTMFFWGFFPCLFRGDWKWAVVTLLASSFSFSLFALVFAFLYNKVYINDLIDKGYVPKSSHDSDILATKGIASPLPYDD